jgi:acetyltransferase EpsM
VPEDGRPLLILGTGILALEIADVVSEIPGVNVEGFVENRDRDRCREQMEGLPVYWVEDLGSMKLSHRVVGGLATTRRSEFIQQAAALEMEFASLVHPSARVSKKAERGVGSVLGANVVLSAYARIGCHVFVNRGVLIGHHTQIGDFSTVQPGANIAGCCRIAEHVYVGIGAIIVDHIAIGAHSFVSAGSLVTKDVPDGVQVFGSPARVIRKLPGGR